MSGVSFDTGDTGATKPDRVHGAMETQPAVFVETYGCQMNVLDSELVQGQLGALGYRWVSNPLEAHIVLLNTCSVRELAEHKVWSHLGRLAQRKQAGEPLIVGVLGCMAEREGAGIFKRMPHVDVVCGPSELDQLPMLLDNARRNVGPASGKHMALSGHTSRRSSTLQRAQEGLESLDMSRALSPVDNAFQAYVRITRGCNKFCSFCVVPYTRGAEVHRPPSHIIEEVKRLVDAGIREVTLIGQTVNHYVFHEGGTTTSFADLLWQVHEAVPGLPRLRFLTSYPRDFGDDALDAMAAAPRICRYLHIPAQSGSNRLLRLMNRGYKVETYMDLLDRARARMPDICIAGDMIVGFPTEQDGDHQASLDLLRQARYKSCFIFKYSPRPGTVSARRLQDDVPEAVKKARNLELLQFQSGMSLQQHRRRIGQVLDVLVQGQSKVKIHADSKRVHIQRRRSAWALEAASDVAPLLGRTQGDELVAFAGPSSWMGQVVRVRAMEATPVSIVAEHC